MGLYGGGSVFGGGGTGIKTSSILGKNDVVGNHIADQIEKKTSGTQAAGSWDIFGNAIDKNVGGSAANAWQTSIPDQWNKGKKTATELWDKAVKGAEGLKDLFDPNANKNILSGDSLPPWMQGWGGPGSGGVRAPTMPGGGSGMGGGGSPAENEFRAAQMSLINQLQDQASGVGPSIAANQLAAGNEASLAASIAQANSARGGMQPSLARAALQTNAEISGKAASEAATARLQEQMQAAGLLGDVASSGRGQDIALSNAKDQLAAQYAQMGLDADKANQAADIQLKQLMQSGALDLKKLEMAALTGDREFLGNMFNSAGGLVGALGTVLG